jgi:hypothetical protein
MPSDYKETLPPDKTEQVTVRAPSHPKVGDVGRRSMQGSLEKSSDTQSSRSDTGEGTEEEQSPGSLERNQYKLRQQIEGGVPEGYEAHHLIPINEAKSSTALPEAAKVGYDINNGNNGIALPKDEAEAKKTGKPLHRGNPSPEYKDFVTDLLQELDDDYIAAKQDGEPWSKDELLKQAHQVEDTIRKALTQRKVFIHKEDPNKNR